MLHRHIFLLLSKIRTVALKMFALFDMFSLGKVQGNEQRKGIHILSRFTSHDWATSQYCPNNVITKIPKH